VDDAQLHHPGPAGPGQRGGVRAARARPLTAAPERGGIAIGADQHYYAQQPQAAHRPGLVHVVLPGLHLALETDAGVFSAGRLDPGTRVLLDTAPAPPPAGNLLDLGCGYGPLALTLATRSPQAAVWAVDVNERALGLCAGNAERAGLGNVHCVRPDDPGLPAALDVIWSNPPIRIGKQALHGLLRDWLGRLAPGGSAYLVVQRHLGADSLHRWLAESGWPVTRVAARSGYRVLRVDPAAPG
jgi:16S rRNA (guanine1207-N2)-methyltransferase